MHTGLGRKAQKKKGVSINLEPRLLGCRYLSVRRRDPTCEASGQRAIIWKHQSRGGLAEIGRLNVSERHGFVRTNRLKMLTSLSQNGMWVGSSHHGGGDSSKNSHRTRRRSRPGRNSSLGNRVSPTRPAAKRKPDRKGWCWRRG